MTLEDELRDLVAQGERALRPGADPGKAALMPQYRLLLRVLAGRQPATAARADAWLRVLRALREPHERAALPAAGERVDPVTSPLAVMSAWLCRLPGHVLLAIEPAADALTLMALRGGPEPVAERLALGRASEACVQAIEQLIGQHLDDVERLRRGEPIDDAYHAPIRAAGERAFAELPAGVRTLVAGADTLLCWRSAFGSLGQLPLELLRDGGQWLGLSHAIGHFGSWRTLAETLSANRMPQQLRPSACVVRARQGSESDPLAAAAPEAAEVAQALRRAGLDVTEDSAPTRASVMQALDAGHAVLHFIGHGMADGFGELLPLGASEPLRPEDASGLAGWRTPFVYLSTCELGRQRAGDTGRVLGFAHRLLEKGAPAVVGCIQPINDGVARAIASAFHRAAAGATVARALMQARGELVKLGLPPACWGATVLFGDPNLRLPNTGAVARQTCGLTLDWAGHVGRWAALRDPQAQARACAALRAAGPDELHDAVLAWVESSFGRASASDRAAHAALCERVAAVDALGGAALRILHTLEMLDGDGARTEVLPVIAAALAAAVAVHDGIAMPVLALHEAEERLLRGADAASRMRARHLLDEAEGALEGWVAEEPAARAVLDHTKRLRATL